jgi:hypothetical protein
MTAGDVVERIRKNVGVPWRDTTYRDTFKAGGPATPVTGIATTAFASFDVVRRAIAQGLNMIVPHETGGRRQLRQSRVRARRGRTGNPERLDHAGPRGLREAGPLEMTQWIGRFVTEVPVRLIKAGEPF